MTPVAKKISSGNTATLSIPARSSATEILKRVVWIIAATRICVWSQITRIKMFIATARISLRTELQLGPASTICVISAVSILILLNRENMLSKP